MIRLGPFEKELSKLKKDVKELSSATEIMKESLITWLGPEGLLNERQAENLAMDIKLSLWKQDFPGADVPLHPFTLETRERLGISSTKIGVATGTMFKAIQAIHEGKGKFSVGIPSGVTTGDEGKIDSVREAAWIFEVGYPGQNIDRPIRMVTPSRQKKGREQVKKPVHEQPSRPFFWPAVLEFMGENLEKNAKETIYKAFTRGLRKWQRFGGAQYGDVMTVQDFAHQAEGFDFGTPEE